MSWRWRGEVGLIKCFVEETVEADCVLYGLMSEAFVLLFYMIFYWEFSWF